ncbi:MULTISPECIES: response regulator [Cyanophyceae]|uniref:hybrid sensor histidine kinase/response regulator n=1 Tax=Cyanophyceae TaxID=3028117 RepID=UPI0016856A12|nr:MULTISPECIES: response regulator [Cyanophyceae]MBD1916774.1 response regulator [Phormidium sp. FACHB-77]MBD2029404.1 response regulator [Phormidium sp. FACHB-322]MBD2051979.1 response regulator [Leptolyngbya sp. FACHB-60]
MSPEDQKRILGYFIEEAKDHLNTIEQGLLNLADTLNDSEMMNEVFRAAHSVKGGAAMLGLNSIQRTSHRMEDFFKVMKESPMRPDRDLETMLLQIFDGLQEQLEQLQSPFGLTNDQAQEIMAPLEPIFVKAEAHIDSLIAAAPAAVPAAAPPRPTVVAAAPHPETSALQLVFRSDVPALLRDMLATFKQPDNSTSRQALSRLCQRMHSVGEQFELAQWCSLTQVVERAIANPDQTYRSLAPVVIKDLKQAQDQVLAGGLDQVAASRTLQDLLPVQAVPELVSDDSTLDALLAEALNDNADGPDLADLFAAAEEVNTDDLALANTENWLEDLALDSTDNVTETGLESVFGQFDTSRPAEPAMPQDMAGSVGPEVGEAELNSLADLFEGAPESLTDIWEEDLAEVSLEDLDLDDDATADSDSSEFADLFATEAAAADPGTAENLAIDDMASLFGYDLDAGAEVEPAAGNEPNLSTGSVNSLTELLTEDAAPELTAASETAIDPLADFLDDGSSLVAGEMADAPLDDFFDMGESAEAGATSANSNEVDSFFDSLHDDDFIDDDDAHTMPELHLELDLDSSSSDGSSGDNNGLFSGGSSHLLTTDNQVPSADAASAAAANLFGEADAFLDDPFGELKLTDSAFDLAFDDTPEEATEEENLAATEADASFDIPTDDGDGTELTAASFEIDGGWSKASPEEASFADLESLLDDPVLEADLFTGSDSSFNDGLRLPDEAFDMFGGDTYNGNGYAETTPTPASQSFDDYGGDNDSFDDLEALLGEDFPVTDTADLGQLDNGLPTASASLDSCDDEFDDLEKLLEEADQLGGSAPSLGVRRATSMQAARRSPRRATNTTDQTMRVSVGHLDNLSNLVGELVVNRNSLEQDQERLRQFLDNLLHQVSQLNDVGQRMRDLYERSLLESSLIANRQAFALGVSSSDRGGGHATGATFDALEMDRFTGFHTLSQEMIELIVRVREASSDIEFTIDSTDQIARQFRQVTTQLQEGLNKARMVPFGQTADRLPRAVRDISLRCGKEAQLVVEGRDTLIDKMILERLYDPMTHLVNNAITHGIESPEERLATGKGREGTITVRAFYQGNQTVIYIADNGGGINPAVVKAKALKQGLITPAEAQTMTEIEVYDLLFLPGFSTRDQADDFSGRGVGMDVVRTALSDIRGSITVESEVGKGTSFTIRLPLTLSITKALSCVNNQARIAFPMDGVEDMFDVPRERIQTDAQGHACILWRDTLLPFRPLSDLLRFNRSLGRGRVYGGPQDEDVVSMVVLRSASTFIALQVDQVIGEQEIVIKQLEGPVPKPIGIAGATVLGDGRVMPIADVLELIDLASGRLRRDASTSLWTQTVDEEPVETVAQTDPTVLIVDDSITVRELLSMSFNKIGYRVEQARDGQEAWEKLRSGLPCDLVFCDIEMPRMDGLELLSRMQKDDTLSQVPTAMLTSRGADRHRQMAVDLGAKGYFTKPYLEEMLLDAAKRMLKGENMIRRRIVEEPEI